jgi:hypothetical protein
MNWLEMPLTPHRAFGYRSTLGAEEGRFFPSSLWQAIEKKEKADWDERYHEISRHRCPSAG